MTKQERKSERAAKALIKALNLIESYDGDPLDVLADADVLACRTDRPDCLRILVNVLRRYYEGTLEELIEHTVFNCGVCGTERCKI